MGDDVLLCGRYTPIVALGVNELLRATLTLHHSTVGNLESSNLLCLSNPSLACPMRVDLYLFPPRGLRDCVVLHTELV